MARRLPDTRSGAVSLAQGERIMSSKFKSFAEFQAAIGLGKTLTDKERDIELAWLQHNANQQFIPPEVIDLGDGEKEGIDLEL